MWTKQVKPCSVSPFKWWKKNKTKQFFTCSLRQLDMLWLVHFIKYVHVMANFQDDPTAHVWINRGKFILAELSCYLPLICIGSHFCRHISTNSWPMQFKYNIDWCSCWPLKAFSVIWRMKPLNCNYTSLTVRDLLPPALLLQGCWPTSTPIHHFMLVFEQISPQANSAKWRKVITLLEALFFFPSSLFGSVVCV